MLCRKRLPGAHAYSRHWPQPRAKAGNIHRVRWLRPAGATPLLCYQPSRCRTHPVPLRHTLDSEPSPARSSPSVEHLREDLSPCHKSSITQPAPTPVSTAREPRVSSGGQGHPDHHLTLWIHRPRPGAGAPALLAAAPRSLRHAQLLPARAVCRRLLCGLPSTAAHQLAHTRFTLPSPCP